MGGVSLLSDTDMFVKMFFSFIGKYKMVKYIDFNLFCEIGRDVIILVSIVLKAVMEMMLKSQFQNSFLWKN